MWYCGIPSKMIRPLATVKLEHLKPDQKKNFSRARSLIKLINKFLPPFADFSMLEIADQDRNFMEGF